MTQELEDRRRFYLCAKMWLHVNKYRYVTESNAVAVIPEKLGLIEDTRIEDRSLETYRVN